MSQLLPGGFHEESSAKQPLTWCWSVSDAGTYAFISNAELAQRRRQRQEQQDCKSASATKIATCSRQSQNRQVYDSVVNDQALQLFTLIRLIPSATSQPTAYSTTHENVKTQLDTASAPRRHSKVAIYSEVHAAPAPNLYHGYMELLPVSMLRSGARGFNVMKAPRADSELFGCSRYVHEDECGASLLGPSTLYRRAYAPR